MLKGSLIRYIQRDIDNVINRMVLGRNGKDSRRYVSLGIRVNNRGEIEVTYRSMGAPGNPWKKDVEYLGTVDLDEKVITGLDIDNRDFRDKTERFLDRLEKEEVVGAGIGILNESYTDHREDVEDTDIRIV